MLVVKRIPEIRLVDMKFERSDAHNGTCSISEVLFSAHLELRLRSNRFKLTIFLVQILNMKGELALLHDLEIKFVPFRERGKFGTGEFGKRREVQAIDCQ
jgi:hypothetical protein